jgi:hypothetical protein
MINDGTANRLDKIAMDQPKFVTPTGATADWRDLVLAWLRTGEDGRA